MAVRYRSAPRAPVWKLPRLAPRPHRNVIRAHVDWDIVRKEVRMARKNRRSNVQHNHGGWPRLCCLKSRHLLIHAALGFAEYHIVDVLFHYATGTDATHLALSMIGF